MTKPVNPKCKNAPICPRSAEKRGDSFRPTCYRCRRTPEQVARMNQRNLAALRKKGIAEDVSYRQYKKDRCYRCGFVPEDPCQLDVDHVDGNHYNNDLTNLQTLCANCHRLKTHKRAEWLS